MNHNKKNRVVEIPSSLLINGHRLPWVTRVTLNDDDDPRAQFREVTVSFLASSYRYRSRGSATSYSFHSQTPKRKMLELLTRVARHGHTTRRRLLALKLIKMFREVNKSDEPQ
jgi:hypothetical protein